MSIQQIEGYGDGSFDEMIKGSDPRMQVLAKALRNLIEGIYPKTIEVVWPNLKMAGYGVGPKKMTNSSYLTWRQVDLRDRDLAGLLDCLWTMRVKTEYPSTY